MKIPEVLLKRLRPAAEEEVEEDLFAIAQEQEQIAGVDTSLVEIVGAVGSARAAVVDRLPSAQGDYPPSDNPRDILRAGRQQVLRRIAAQRSDLRQCESVVGASDDASDAPRDRALRELTQQFAQSLEGLVANTAHGEMSEAAVEQTIRAMVDSYIEAVRRLGMLARFKFE